MLTGALEPGDDVTDVGGGPEVRADPAGRGPLQSVELDGRVPLNCGLGDLPFVAGVAVDPARGGLDAGLGAVAGVDATADLQLEHLQGGGVVGPEHVVVDLVT